jgi:hypothetical protein
MGFDRRLVLVGQLDPAPGKKLDAIVLRRIVRGRDHHTQDGPG